MTTKPQPENIPNETFQHIKMIHDLAAGYTGSQLVVSSFGQDPYLVGIFARKSDILKSVIRKAWLLSSTGSRMSRQNF